jgi:hypothetical protein
METRDAYKLRQEAFVSNLHGSEVGALLAAASVLPLMHALIQAYAEVFNLVCRGPQTTPARAVLQFVFQVALLSLACFTAVANNAPPGWMKVAPMIMILGGLAVIHPAWGGPAIRPAIHAGKKRLAYERDADLIRSAVSAYRGSIMLLTCFAILGVDFPLFARAHAKTEAYGASLMDLGVGAVVTASAMTARVGGTESLPSRLLSSLSAVAIPSFLGAVRLFTHSAVKYQHHMSEYGLHWNFYWTVSAIALLMAGVEVVVGLATRAFKWARITHLLRTSHPSAPYIAAPIALTLAYQVALRWPLSTPFDLTPGCMEGLREPPACAGATVTAAALGSSFLAPPHTLEAYILCAPRFPGGFWAANREGIASTLGFLALHLLGLAAGRAIAAARAGMAPGMPGQIAVLTSLIRSSVGVAAVAWGAYFTLADPNFLVVPGLRNLLAFVGPSPPSRRLANAPFVALSIAMNATQMCIYLLVALLTALAYKWRGEPRSAARRTASPGGRAGSRLRRGTAAAHAPAPSAVSLILLEAINAVFFPVFLLANLQTGVVNATMKTLDVGDGGAATVLFLHTLSLCGFAAGSAAVGWRPRLKL